MAKTYLMPGETLTEEQREESRRLTQEREQHEKDRLAQEAENSKKIRVSLEQMLKTRIVPEEDRIVVWPDPVETITAGGIIKVEETIKKEEQAILMGTVLAVGPGKKGQQNLTNRLLLSLLTYHVPAENLLPALDLTIKEYSREFENIDQITLQPGDHIMYGRFAGTKVEDPETKEGLLIMRPMDIFAKIRK